MEPLGSVGAEIRYIEIVKRFAHKKPIYYRFGPVISHYFQDTCPLFLVRCDLSDCTFDNHITISADNPWIWYIF
jgi:hypothetical protein